MGAMASLYIKRETLEVLLNTVNKKGDKGVALTISIDDETNQWGQNVSSFVEQTKEQREAEMKRFYVGNGKVFWTKDGTIKVAQRVDQQEQAAPAEAPSGLGADEDDLPF